MITVCVGKQDVNVHIILNPKIPKCATTQWVRGNLNNQRTQ